MLPSILVSLELQMEDEKEFLKRRVTDYNDYNLTNNEF